MQIGGKADPNSSFQSSQGRSGKPNPGPPAYLSSQDSGNLRSAEGARRIEKPALIINPFDFIPEFSDDDSESNGSPQTGKNEFDMEDSLTKGIKPAGLPVNPHAAAKLPNQVKAPASTASNSESLANRDKTLPKEPGEQNSGRNAYLPGRQETERSLGSRQIEIPSSSVRTLNPESSNSKVAIPRQQQVEPRVASTSSTDLQWAVRPTKMDEEKQLPQEKRALIGVELPRAGQEPPKPNKIEPETSNEQATLARTAKGRNSRVRSSTEARKNRLSPGSNLQSLAEVPTFAVGESIPKAQFERILIDISKDFRGHAKQGLYDRVAVAMLRSVTEAYLVEQFRRASLITRARGKLTINRIDLETLNLLDNDPFIRRSNSAPSIAIAGC